MSHLKKATKWDSLESLKAEEDITVYLNTTFEDGSISMIATTLGNIAWAKGMTQLAKETGITRDGLCKALLYREPIVRRSAKGRKDTWTKIKHGFFSLNLQI